MPANLEPDERSALRLAEALKPIFADVRARLPDGTDFAILIDVPPMPNEQGTVVAMSTDRERMAFCAGTWIVSDCDPLGRQARKRS